MPATFARAAEGERWVPALPSLAHGHGMHSTASAGKEACAALRWTCQGRSTTGVDLWRRRRRWAPRRDEHLPCSAMYAISRKLCLRPTFAVIHRQHTSHDLPPHSPVAAVRAAPGGWLEGLRRTSPCRATGGVSSSSARGSYRAALACSPPPALYDLPLHVPAAFPPLCVHGGRSAAALLPSTTSRCPSHPLQARLTTAGRLLARHRAWRLLRRSAPSKVRSPSRRRGPRARSQ